MQPDKRALTEGGTEPRTRGGSPDMKCHHALRQTATGTSSPEEINVTLVPLFLVPRAVADTIRRHGRAVREIHVRRTRNHQYTVEVERGRP
ncbi:hypothetical protein BN140_2082 [Methanoculleus bourgensis MS2]|uniref:Uncharacterized protein n=1 Tax=Methanoculleus bourgensis (strain ATCC 43281 / DSM 3045 / OCM 15 / MS2) TaxID=1201294 RepID=I7L0S7_METBM|nr:hypothetical protein [Methanoculleus bourgensis]CCJ37005.1 hypothetical protein BN140_2082 [Methanoculleus bourgensis MS2]